MRGDFHFDLQSGSRCQSLPSFLCNGQLGANQSYIGFGFFCINGNTIDLAAIECKHRLV